MVRSLVVSLAAFAAVSMAPARAQCVGPDSLAGPCCTLQTETLPTFPPFTMQGTSICWDACVLSSQTCVQVSLTAPVRVHCGEYTVDLLDQDCSGNPLLKSQLHLDYTRTWIETPVPGQQIQVWRFVVKADVGASATTFGCTIPSCLGTHPTAFYYGYVDYALDCGAGTWSVALALYHGCDAYQHAPAFSSRPGVFHPGRSFALVAPSTPANPFVATASVPLGGPIFVDGTRDAGTSPAPFACEATESVLNGQLFNLISGCACPLAFSPVQITARHLDASGVCGSAFRSLNFFPFLPWLETMSISLGTWTTTASYPGVEAVWAEEGAFLHVEGCTASGAPETYGEVKYGATTEGGYPAGVAGLVTDRFTDLVDNYSKLLGTPLSPPYFGSLNPTRHLVFVNSI